MKVKVVVMGVSRYSFPDQKTNQLIEGTKVNYIEQVPADEENVIGHTPQSAVLDYHAFDKFLGKGLPAVYDCDLSVSLVGRKPSLKINGFEYVAPIEFRTLHQAK